MSSPSSESSCDQPMKNLPFAITDATVTDPSMWKTLRSESPEPSGVSVKSNASMMDPPALSEATVTSEPTMWKRLRSKSPEPSGVSVKSNASMMDPPALSEATVTSDPSRREICALIRYVPSSTSHYQINIRQERTEAVLQTHTMKTTDLQRVKDQYKTSIKIKYERLFEGNKLKENESLLNRIYTQLYIIEGEREGVNEEHEVLQMEKTARTQHSQDTPIDCNDIFKASPEPECEEKDQIKTVLTKGIDAFG
ncbi:uncharacterized protein LOC122135444 [Cyprinus carpio]|uniref:Uncharacterized protein LOC122135444 n=1 Tax=Cyprinus carpio TaxID=7962 RepID=A0A9Q9VTC7_CYPCA|nr:uncharacterized protein LOC122135444 [Cyprinus carpio]